MEWKEQVISQMLDNLFFTVYSKEPVGDVDNVMAILVSIISAVLPTCF